MNHDVSISKTVMAVNCGRYMDIVTTYGCSLYARVIGLFCGWRTVMGSVVWLAAKMVKYALSDDGKNGQV